MNDLNPVDISVIETLKTLMKDRFGFLIQTFIDKTDNQIDQLHIAITNNDIKEVISITHAIKGSSGSVGASSVHLLSKEYENNARNDVLNDISNWADLLRIEYERYKNEIQNHL